MLEIGCEPGLFRSTWTFGHIESHTLTLMFAHLRLVGDSELIGLADSSFSQLGLFRYRYNKDCFMALCKFRIRKWLLSHAYALISWSQGCRSNLVEAFWLLQSRMGDSVMMQSSAFAMGIDKGVFSQHSANGLRFLFVKWRYWTGCPEGASALTSPWVTQALFWRPVW